MVIPIEQNSVGYKQKQRVLANFSQKVKSVRYNEKSNKVKMHYAVPETGNCTETGPSGGLSII